MSSKKRFENIRFHRAAAAGIGASFAAGSCSNGIFTGLVISVVWLIGEVMSFVIFDYDETNG